MKLQVYSNRIALTLYAYMVQSFRKDLRTSGNALHTGLSPTLFTTLYTMPRRKPPDTQPINWLPNYQLAGDIKQRLYGRALAGRSRYDHNGTGRRYAVKPHIRRTDQWEHQDKLM
jgi:hypothetical protein